MPRRRWSAKYWIGYSHKPLADNPMAGRVQMLGLRRLHTAMRANGDQSAHFQLTHNGIDFDCLFLVDVTPYEFVLAAIGHPDVALLLPVRRGYFVEADRRRLKAAGQAVRSGRADVPPLQPRAVPALDRSGHSRPLPATTGNRRQRRPSRPTTITSNTATGLTSSAGATTICAATRSATPTWPRPNAASGQRSAHYASARTRVRVGMSPSESGRSSRRPPSRRRNKARACWPRAS